jgi:hypothetical protein
VIDGVREKVAKFYRHDDRRPEKEERGGGGVRRKKTAGVELRAL